MNDADAISEMISLERFVNDGSPTGLTWSHSSSLATCPRNGPREFLLPLLCLDENDCIVLGTVPIEFRTERGYHFAVHPDCVHLLDLRLRALLSLMAPQHFVATPTASPRTVHVSVGNWRGFLKLDYPMILGRFKRDLNGQKLRHGIDVSNFLVQTDAATQGIYHFPEIGAIEVQTTTSHRSGMLFRLDRPIGPQFARYIPICSLFGSRIFEPWLDVSLVVELARIYGGVSWIRERVLLPLLRSLWDLVTEKGLWPEPHAQNVVLGLNHDGSTGIVWRDCQGFSIDEDLAKMSPSDSRKVLAKGTYASLEKRSYLYDWMLGKYILDPLLSAVEREYAGTREELSRSTKQFTNDVLRNVVGPNFMPTEAYGMSLASPDGKRLPIVKVGVPSYR